MTNSVIIDLALCAIAIILIAWGIHVDIKRKEKR